MRLTPSPFAFVILVVFSLLAGCGGGGGGRTGPTGPPPGFTFATIRMMKVTPPGDPPLELGRMQLTIPLASTSDSLAPNDPGFDAAINQDLTTNADAIIPVLHQLTDQQLNADAALPLLERKLSGTATCDYFQLHGMFGVPIGPEILRIENHTITNPTYFDSKLRFEFMKYVRIWVTDQGGKIANLKDVRLEFIFN